MQTIGSWQRQQLIDFGLLRHGVDEIVVAQQQAVDSAFAVGVQHQLDHTDDLGDLRLVAQVSDAADDVDLDPLEESQRFVARRPQ